MRFRALLFAAAVCLMPTVSILHAEPNTEAKVVKLDGTIMVEHVDESGVKSQYALATNGTVTRGDFLTVYDKSWVILKDGKGDLIGFEGPTSAAFDELFKGGPDRQVRILLKSGTCLVKSKNSKSKQSFFEVHAGSLVSVLGSARASFSYTPDASRAEVSYFGGKLKTTDADGERKFYLDSRRVWENGKLVQGDPMQLPDEASLNFKRFFEGQPPIVPDQP
jgi:hypothetical protein